MKRPNTNLLLHEIFDKVEAAENTAARIVILQNYASYELKTVLVGAFTPNIQWDLPEGAPPYIPNDAPAGLQRVPVGRAIKGISDLIVGRELRGQHQRVLKERRFVGILELLHARDAEILIAMKDKSLSKMYPKLTASLAKKAFPSVFS